MKKVLLKNQKLSKSNEMSNRISITTRKKSKQSTLLSDIGVILYRVANSQMSIEEAESRIENIQKMIQEVRKNVNINGQKTNNKI